MNKKAHTWLATYFETTPNYIQEMLKDENATTYLLVWPVFEQMLFSGFMKKTDIPTVAQKYAPYYQELNIETSVQHFHNRYQDHNKLRNLQHNDSFACVSSILAQNAANLSDEDKLTFMLYVVYRYRNNIFHGNKGIESWSSYTTQIELCLNFMMTILDCTEKHKGEIK